MEIILNCVECEKSPSIKQLENEDFSIYCKYCNQEITGENREDVIEKWNQKNNKYEHIFGVRFDFNEDKETIDKSLDGLITFDQIKSEKIKMFQNLLNDELISAEFDELKELFPECISTAQEINGLQLRKTIHLPNYKLYRFTFSEELGREDIEQLVKNLSLTDLKKYEYNIKSKQKE